MVTKRLPNPAVPQSIAGKASGQKRRAKALEAYYQDPNVCLYCGSILHVRSGQKVYAVRQRKFCNRSCAAKYNNPRRVRRRTVKTCHCLRCGKEFLLRQRPHGGHYRRKYCDDCRYLARSDPNFTSLAPSQQTKSELFSCRGWHLARAAIQHHAHKVHGDNSSNPVCAVCGYDKHVELCHIRPVSDFPDNSTVAEINDPSNLTTLCPNCHWELDHNLLVLPKDCVA